MMAEQADYFTHTLSTTLYHAHHALPACIQSPPDHFLAGLSGILEHRPHDVLFKIVPEPGVGCE